MCAKECKSIIQSTEYDLLHVLYFKLNFERLLYRKMGFVKLLDFERSDEKCFSCII